MKEIQGFTNANIVYKDGVRKGSLTIQGGKILSLECQEGISLPDYLFLSPGFIDQHIHGANHFDAMDGKVSSLEGIANILPHEGVTSFNATTMTMDVPSIEKALRAINEYMAKPRNGARIIGAHLEGPFISPKHPGAQDPKYILKPDAKLFAHFDGLSGHHINEVTLAYEEGGEELLAYCVEHHITASIGHSDCSSELFKKAVKEGLHCVTHLFNAQRGFHHREPGIVGEALLTDGVKVEIICDKKHCTEDAFALAFKSKKKEDIILITDACQGKYLAPGKYQLGGNDIYIYDGVAHLEDGTIAASILKLNEALKNVSSVAKGYSFADLINCVSYNVAQNLGWEDKIGSIAPGLCADFAIIDKDFNVYATIVGGKLVYEKEGFHL